MHRAERGLSSSGAVPLVRALVASAALALTGACTSLTPDFERPALPVAERFADLSGSAASAVLPGAARAAADTAWTDHFGDPALRELIARALRNNRDLRVAVLNIEIARANLQLRRADAWPTIGAGVSASRQTQANGSTASLYSAGLQLSAYEVDLFGRVRALGDAAAAQWLASQAGRDAAQVALVAAVAQQALAVSAGDELLELTRQTLRSRLESLRLTQLRLDQGVATELDLQGARSLVESARVALAQTQRQRALDLNALVLLVGEPLPAGTALPLPPPLERIVLPELPEALGADVLLQRPDVRQAEQLLIAANANIGAARAAFWPRISLTGSLGTASPQLADLFQTGAYGFVAQLVQPLFDAGRNRAGLAVSQAQRDVAIAQYERAIQAGFREVADALAGRATLGEQLSAAQAQADAEARRLDLAELRLRNGVSSSLEALDAQRSAFAARQAVVQTRLALLQNRVALYRALGGGAGGTPRLAAPL